MRKYILLISLYIISKWALAISIPTPSSPSNGSTVNNYFEVFLYANQVSQATGYIFQCDSVSTFNSPNLKCDTSNLNGNYSQVVRPNKTYYWRVKAFKSGDTSAWSSYYTFIMRITGTQLGAPANGSTGPIKLFSSYSAGAYATYIYQFEVDTTASFNSPLHTFTTGNNPYFVDSALFTFGRKFYWRARTISQYNDTLPWSAVWNYTTNNTAALNASTNLMMIDPYLLPNWTNAGLARTQVQFDTVATFSSPGMVDHLVKNNLIQDTLPDLYFGKRYYLRIRHEFAGKYTPWSFTANYQVYANGNINSPYNGYTFNGVTNLAFSWRNLNGTKSQILQYRDSVWGALALDSNKLGYNFVYNDTLRLYRKYSWKVRYYHAKDTTPWLVGTYKIYNGIVNLGTPYNNSVNIDIHPRLNFRKNAWAQKHVMQIDTGAVMLPNRSSYFIQIDSFKYDGSYYHFMDTMLRYNQKYVWGVYCMNNLDTGALVTNTFTTKAAPVNYYPPNNFIGLGTSSNGLITGITGSTWVQWELDTTPLFNSAIYATGTDPHIPDDFTPQYVALNFPASLRFHATYYWRARCINSVDTSEWSATWNFLTTQDVWNVAPLNGAVNQGISVKLQWGIQGSNMEQRYQYQASKDSTFTGTPIMTLPAESTSEAIINCQYATKYYWRARAMNDIDTSRWSATWNFTTANPPAVGTPILISPANGASNLPAGSVTLTWNASSNALSYDIEVSDDALFSNIIASANTAGTGAIFSNAQNKVKYYWRVRGRYNTVTSGWSNPRWFQIAPPTGLIETGNIEILTIYPNPAGQNLYITTTQEMEVYITDMKGTTLWSGKVFGSNQIETATWPRGIYLVLGKTEQGNVQRKLILE